MDIDKTIQGTLLAMGAGTIASGINFVTQRDFIVGLPLVLIGFGLVYWREARKQI